MTAISVSIAEAVKEHVAAATLSQAVAPERSYADWDIDLKDLEVLHVDVAYVTSKLLTELVGRGVIKHTVPVDVAVRKRLTRGSNGRLPLADIDALALLVEEIHKLFIPQRLTTFTAGAWEETKTLANPVPKHLRGNSQFTGIVRVTFTACEDLA